MEPAAQERRDDPPWAGPPRLTATSFVSPSQLDAVSDTGSTADWVSVHATATPQDEPDAQSLSGGHSVAEGELPALAEPQVPVCVQPHGGAPSDVASTGDPAVEEAYLSPRTTDASSLDAGLVPIGVQREPEGGRWGNDSAEDALGAVLEATLAPKMEAALRGVWDGSGRRDVTDRGRVVRLRPDGVVLKAKDLLQRLVALLCRDGGTPAGKQAAADLIAWMVADPSCARAMKRPEKIVKTLVALVGEDVLEIKRNGARAIRNLAEQSAVYAKELAVPERLDTLTQTPPMSDALLCVYFAETVVSLERHLRGSDAWTGVGDRCIAPLLDAIIAAREPRPMAAALSALKSLSAQSRCADMICTFPPAMKKICSVVTWTDGDVGEAAVGLLAWLLMGDLSPRRLWQELLNDEESSRFVRGLFSLLDLGQTETEASLLRLLIGHPNLAHTGAVGAPQLRSVEGLLNSKDCSLVCQDHAMTLLLKVVNEGLDPAAFVVGSDLVLTLIQHVIQLKGDNRHVRNLALELLMHMVTKDSGVSVIETVIECDGVDVVKYLLQETAPEKQADLAPLLALLWAVSRTEGGKALVRAAGIVPLLVEKLTDPVHGTVALHCLHHFVVDDAKSIDALAAGCEPPILEALAGMLRMGAAACEDAPTHPLQVLALVMSRDKGRDAVVRDMNRWVTLLMSFTGDEMGAMQRALDCIMCLHSAMADDDRHLRHLDLALDDQSLRFVSWMLSGSPQHQYCALWVLRSSRTCGGAAALDASQIYANLFRLVGKEGIADSDVGWVQVLLQAVVWVAAVDLGACAMQVLRHQVQDALWSLATQAHFYDFEDMLSLLRAVRDKEVDTRGDGGLVQCMRAALEDKEQRIHQLEVAFHGQGAQDSQATELQKALAEKDRLLAEYEAEKKEQQHGIQALTDLVNQQHLLIRDLRAAAEGEASVEGSSSGAVATETCYWGVDNEERD